MIPEYKLYRASSGLMFFHFLSILLLLSQLVGGFHFGGSFPLRGGVGSFVVTHISSDVNVCSPWTTRQFGARTSRRARSLTVNGAFQNEYQTFFNDASRLGQAFISSLSPEERAKRAYEVRATCRGYRETVSGYSRWNITRCFVEKDRTVELILRQKEIARYFVVSCVHRF